MENIQAISVDDEEFNLKVVEELASFADLDVRSFKYPMEAMRFLENNEIDMAFIDYLMPEMDGVELIKKIRYSYPDIPIIMITSHSENKNLRLSAINAGATEFLTKPIDASDFIPRVRNLITLRRSQLLLKDKAKLLEEEVNKAIASIKIRENETLQILGKTAEYKDPETANHIVRVAHYSKLIAGAIGEDERTQDLIFQSSQLHDVGKIGISDSILFSSRDLSDRENEIVKSHPIIGYDILKDTSSKYLQTGAIIALTHHEKYDGTGYPYGLKGEKIYYFGRIVSVADVFDALTTRRPYKEPWALERAYDWLYNQRGLHFDPKFVDAFLKNCYDVEEIYNNFSDDFF